VHARSNGEYRAKMQCFGAASIRDQTLKRLPLADGDSVRERHRCRVPPEKYAFIGIRIPKYHCRAVPYFVPLAEQPELWPVTVPICVLFIVPAAGDREQVLRRATELG
jgi:hypothetical protein